MLLHRLAGLGNGAGEALSLVHVVSGMAKAGERLEAERLGLACRHNHYMEVETAVMAAENIDRDPWLPAGNAAVAAEEVGRRPKKHM